MPAPGPTDLPLRFPRRTGGAASQSRALGQQLRQCALGDDAAWVRWCDTMHRAADADVLRLLKRFSHFAVYQQWTLAGGVASRFDFDAARGVWWTSVHDWLATRRTGWGGEVGQRLGPVLFRYRRRIECWAAIGAPRRVLRVLHFTDPRLRRDALEAFAHNPRCSRRLWATVVTRWAPASQLCSRWRSESLSVVPGNTGCWPREARRSVTETV